MRLTSCTSLLARPLYMLNQSPHASKSSVFRSDLELIFKIRCSFGTFLLAASVLERQVELTWPVSLATVLIICFRFLAPYSIPPSLGCLKHPPCNQQEYSYQLTCPYCANCTCRRYNKTDRQADR